MMKYYLRMGAAAILALWFSGIAVAENINDPQTYTGPIENKKQICMTMKNAVQAKEGIEVPYKGKAYYLCCMGCVAQFRKNPEVFRVAEDPVNHAVVDKADGWVYAYKGRAYFFESEDNLEAFSKDPSRYLSVRE